MAAGNTHVADPVDTVHHEMDSTICSHCVYKTVWSPVIGEHLILKGAYWPIHKTNLLYMAVIKDSQISGCIPSEIYSQITWYYITLRGSVVRYPALSYYWEKEKRLRSTV